MKSSKIFSQIKTEKDLYELKKKILNDDILYRRLLKIRKKFGFKKKLAKNKIFPANSELLALYREMVEAGEEKPSFDAELLLRKIKTKSNSGVVSVSVLTKPHPCPGNCLYCPTESSMPKSYLSKEPAAARALRNNFNPYKQTVDRLSSLYANGHPVDKVEVIIIGGTWSFYPHSYQKNFVSEVFRACNNFQSKRELKKGEKSLSQLQSINEKAGSRVIGISIETRPDFIEPSEIKKLRELGITKVEIGVQCLDEKILETNRRNSSIKDVVVATEFLRRAGLKITYHMMLNLYGSTPQKDLAMFEKLFSDPRFRPDMLKIYPCVILKGTGLYKIWKSLDSTRDKFKPYSDGQLKDLLIKIKKLVPSYVRIIRVIRDIPAEYIVAGSKFSNLRQEIMKDQKENKWRCKCIRCREIREDTPDSKNIVFKKIKYSVSGGEELFLTYEDKKNDKLISFLRLFIPDTGDRAMTRELHTYGRLVPVSLRGRQSQHLGFGKLLLKEAEKIAKKRGFNKITVISGVGVRDYYRKRGYRLKDTYMVKSLV